MSQINFYVITCDKTAWILKAFSHLTNKYWKRKYNVLGFKKHPGLPGNYIFTSMANVQKNIQNWTRDIYNVLKHETNEFLFFGLDDYLPIDKFNKELFNMVFEYMKENTNVGRYELGYGAAMKKEIQLINGTMFKYGHDAPYRVSCQFSLWRTEYILKFLNHSWNPWEFEVKGSHQSNNDGWEILGTLGEYAWRWIEESALSKRHPGMINVLGLKPQDRDELIELEYINPEKIQYGMSKGDNPKELDISKVSNKYKQFYI